MSVTNREVSENNDKAVLLSEEITFLEELAKELDMPPGVIIALLDRRDILRDAMLTADRADPGDEPDEGIPMSDTSEAVGDSDAYDPEDDTDHAPLLASDGVSCSVCDEPVAEH